MASLQATLHILAGQLAGSLMATLFARLSKAGALPALPVAQTQACPMLLSALLLEGAGQAVASLQPLHASPSAKMPSSSRQKVYLLLVWLIRSILCYFVSMTTSSSECCWLFRKALL